MVQPIAASITLKHKAMSSDWRSTARAPLTFLAPNRCATCTANPAETAEHSPMNSQVVVDTSPMDAEALAPRLPTMAASMYCMVIDEICAMMEGRLNCAVR